MSHHFIYKSSFLENTLLRGQFMSFSGLFLYTALSCWPSRRLTVAPCQLPWIEAIAAARSHLVCGSVLSLLPGNAKDKFSFVNWIALLPEEPAHQYHKELEEVDLAVLLKWWPSPLCSSQFSLYCFGSGGDFVAVWPPLCSFCWGPERREHKSWVNIVRVWLIVSNQPRLDRDKQRLDKCLFGAKLKNIRYCSTFLTLHMLSIGFIDFKWNMLGFVKSL